MFKVEVEVGLELALVEPKFASEYLDIVSNQRNYLSEWLAWPPHAKDEAFFLSFINKSLNDYADGKSLVCAMMYQNKLAGNISFNTINHDLQKVEIGYWLRRDLQGKGIVSKSLSKLIDYAFTQLNMQKVQISAAIDNNLLRHPWLCNKNVNKYYSLNKK